MPKAKDLFTQIVAKEKLSQSFLTLQSASPVFEPAKVLLNKIFDTFKDLDGNFIKDFQSTGFDARLWELFLFEFLKENDFELVDSHNRPDFHVCKNGMEIFVEASSSNASQIDEKYTPEFIHNAMKTKDKVVEKELLEHYVFKIGSVLLSKMNKEYWNNSWVSGKPLIFAIKASHNIIANFLPDAKIISYLYGNQINAYIDEFGKINGEITKLEEHKLKGKSIPSGFFHQPLVENISAIIFTNTCDIYKFNRMGFQLGYSPKNLKIQRTCLCNDLTPGAPSKWFQYRVGENSFLETWSEGVSVFHNPNAKYPLDRNLFKGVRQFWITNGKFDGEMPDFFPFNSLTTNILLS